LIVPQSIASSGFGRSLSFRRKRSISTALRSTCTISSVNSSVPRAILQPQVANSVTRGLLPERAATTGLKLTEAPEAPRIFSSSGVMQRQ